MQLVLKSRNEGILAATVWETSIPQSVSAQGCSYILHISKTNTDLLVCSHSKRWLGLYHSPGNPFRRSCNDTLVIMESQATCDLLPFSLPNIDFFLEQTFSLGKFSNHQRWILQPFSETWLIFRTEKKSRDSVMAAWKLMSRQAGTCTSNVHFSSSENGHVPT